MADALETAAREALTGDETALRRYLLELERRPDARVRARHVELLRQLWDFVWKMPEGAERLQALGPVARAGVQVARIARDTALEKLLAEWREALELPTLSGRIQPNALAPALVGLGGLSFHAGDGARGRAWTERGLEAALGEGPALHAWLVSVAETAPPATQDAVPVDEALERIGRLTLPERARALGYDRADVLVGLFEGTEPFRRAWADAASRIAREALRNERLIHVQLAAHAIEAIAPFATDGEAARREAALRVFESVLEDPKELDTFGLPSLRMALAASTPDHARSFRERLGAHRGAAHGVLLVRLAELQRLGERGELDAAWETVPALIRDAWAQAEGSVGILDEGSDAHRVFVRVARELPLLSRAGDWARGVRELAACIDRQGAARSDYWRSAILEYLAPVCRELAGAADAPAACVADAWRLLALVVDRANPLPLPFSVQSLGCETASAAHESVRDLVLELGARAEGVARSGLERAPAMRRLTHGYRFGSLVSLAACGRLYAAFGDARARSCLDEVLRRVPGLEEMDAGDVLAKVAPAALELDDPSPVVASILHESARHWPASWQLVEKIARLVVADARLVEARHPGLARRLRRLQRLRAEVRPSLRELPAHGPG